MATSRRVAVPGSQAESRPPEPPELRDLGTHILSARVECKLSQVELARRSGLSQNQVSLFETGKRRPSLDQFVRIARGLDVPLQRLLNGSDRPRDGLRDLAVELRRLGANDLWVVDAIWPGASRRPEEVIALALAGSAPEPRIIETIPALLSWNPISPAILRAFGAATRTTRRLAWLADVALAIDRRAGFPGGCRRRPLERFVGLVPLPARDAPPDGLGDPAVILNHSPIWRRWRIGYRAKLDDFQRRAAALSETSMPRRTGVGLSEKSDHR